MAGRDFSKEEYKMIITVVEKANMKDKTMFTAYPNELQYLTENKQLNYISCSGITNIQEIDKLLDFGICEKSNYTYISVDHKYLNKSLIDYAHSKRLRVKAWTIDDENEINNAFSDGIDLAISNLFYKHSN